LPVDPFHKGRIPNSGCKVFSRTSRLFLLGASPEAMTIPVDAASLQVFRQHALVGTKFRESGT
jgi:hypothetical protein